MSYGDIPILYCSTSKEGFLPTGHNIVLQEKVSELGPGQVDPPVEGEGLLQSLVRDLVPPPHVTLQGPNELQTPQFPSVI
jgi:hypothetical protein